MQSTRSYGRSSPTTSSWQPAREGLWKPCTNVDDVVNTLLWRAGMNKMRPFDSIDLGDRVVYQVRGRGIGRLGAKAALPAALPDDGAARRARRQHPGLSDAAAAYAAVGLKTADGRRGVLRSRPHAPAPLLRARARRIVPRARDHLARASSRRRRPGSSSSSCAVRATRPCARRRRTGSSSCADSRRGSCAISSPRRWSRCCGRSCYAEPLHLVEQHRERGEPVYIVSATLQEIVEAIADELGFDGALGTGARSRDGVVHGEGDARAPRGEQGARACASSRSRTASTWPSAPRTPTATRTSRSSRRWASPSRSTPTASCAASRASAAGPSRVQRARVSARAPARAAGRLGVSAVFGAGLLAGSGAVER